VPQEEARISSLYSEPTVTPIGNHLLVSGKLYNSGKVAGTATAVVTLLKNGHAVETVKLKVNVPAEGQTAWSHQFAWGDGEGSWTATVGVE
jgi:hypothetical protein